MTDGVEFVRSGSLGRGCPLTRPANKSCSLMSALYLLTASLSCWPCQALGQDDSGAPQVFHLRASILGVGIPNRGILFPASGTLRMRRPHAAHRISMNASSIRNPSAMLPKLCSDLSSPFASTDMSYVGQVSHICQLRKYGIMLCSTYQHPPVPVDVVFGLLGATVPVDARRVSGVSSSAGSVFCDMSNGAVEIEGVLYSEEGVVSSRGDVFVDPKDIKRLQMTRRRAVVREKSIARRDGGGRGMIYRAGGLERVVFVGAGSRAEWGM